jgi:hypothetical protein
MERLIPVSNAMLKDEVQDDLEEIEFVLGDAVNSPNTGNPVGIISSSTVMSSIRIK